MKDVIAIAIIRLFSADASIKQQNIPTHKSNACSEVFHHLAIFKLNFLENDQKWCSQFGQHRITEKIYLKVSNFYM